MTDDAPETVPRRIEPIEIDPRFAELLAERAAYAEEFYRQMFGTFAIPKRLLDETPRGSSRAEAEARYVYVREPRG